jgi:formamidopyrimidine-DNA glycosylase
LPELPEIISRAKEMKTSLREKTIEQIEVLQPQSLNIPEEEFIEALTGATIKNVSSHGKWIYVETNQGWLLINLGMGGEILLNPCSDLPEKYRLCFRFKDETCFSINFWWFGYVHFAQTDKLHEHKMTAKLGPQAIDLSVEDFQEMISGRRARVKSFLLDQSSIAGIGNAYVHDILFLARLHPLRTLNTLSPTDIENLVSAIHAGLQPSIDKGGAFYEMNLYGEKGGFTMDDILIGYREEQPCPVCQTSIVKIKTGSTSSFICPDCQPIEAGS